MNRTVLILLLCMFCLSSGIAQSVPGGSLSSDFRSEIKSLDEFRARFNGEESKPGVVLDDNSRRNNILALFDYTIEKEKQETEEFHNKINSFVDSVLVNNCIFKIANGGLVAECLCRMKYKGKNKKIRIMLKSEMMDNDRYRWAIVGVNGLEESGIILTDRYYTIAPTQHEVHFMGLHDFLNANPKHAFGYRPLDYKIDNLSVLFTLIYNGLLTFDVVEEQVFHYYDVPGFIFTIKEISRKGDNSGWLIDSIKCATNSEKTIELNKLYGYE